MKTSRTLIPAGVIVLFALLTAFSHGGRVEAQGGNPVLGDPSALRPFQIRLCKENGITGCGQQPEQFIVPMVTTDGKPVLRLVIEFVSGQCSMNNGIARTMSLDTTASGTFVVHQFIPFPTNPGFDAIVSQQTRIYADPGSTVGFNGAVLNSLSQCRMSLSGHLAVQ